MPAPLDASSRTSALLLAALVAVFLLGLSPLTVDYVLFHPDERHYADAGIRMVKSADYLTPRTAEGGLRLKKPILPYWCVAAGYHAVGISPLGARLGFLLAGGGVVALTWWGAAIAFRSRQAACFAAIVAMCQPPLLISAARSVPDVCLALGLQLSACGFIGLLRSGRATPGWLAAAYGGAAVAILSKGLPAAAFLTFASAFLAVRSPALLRRDGWRCLIALLACVTLSGSWFAAMAALHGEALALQFARDQLGPNRFADGPWQLAWQFPLCLTVLVAMFGPWLLAAGTKRNERTSDAEPAVPRSFLRDPAVELLVGWALLYCLLASAINHVTPRYLLPAAAPLSIAVGGLLSAAMPNGVQRRLWWMLAALLPLSVFAIGVAVHFVSPAVASAVPAAATAAALISAAMLRRARSWPADALGAAVAVALHVVLFCAGLTLSSWTGPDFGQRVHERLSALAPQVPRRIVLIGEPAHATRIRMAFGGAADVVCLPHADPSTAVDVVIVDEALHAAAATGCEAATIPCGYREMDVSEVLAAIAGGTLPEFLEQRQRRYIISVRRPLQSSNLARSGARGARDAAGL